MSVTAREEEALGTWKKKIISDAKLTPNGVLTIESTTSWKTIIFHFNTSI